MQINKFVGAGYLGTPMRTGHTRTDTNNQLLSQTLFKRISKQHRANTGIMITMDRRNSSHIAQYAHQSLSSMVVLGYTTVLDLT